MNGQDTVSGTVAAMKDARARLQAMLDDVNAVEAGAPEVTTEAGLFLEELLSGQPMRSRGLVSIRWTRARGWRFKGRPYPAVWDLLTLLIQVGPDRIRRCALPECRRWFVANKRARYDSLEHAQRDRNERRTK